MAPIGFRRFSWKLQLLGSTGSTFALRIHSVSCQDLVQRNSRVLIGPCGPPNYELVSKPIHYCPLLDFYILYINIYVYHDVSTFFSYPLACFATNNNQYIGGAGAGECTMNNYFLANCVSTEINQPAGGPSHFFCFAIVQQSSH